MKYKIIFFGTSEFAIPILKKIIKTDFLELKYVITREDKPSGRNKKIKFSPIKIEALKNKLNVLQPKNLFHLLSKINKESLDLAIVFDYGKIIPKEFLNLLKFGFINLHPSLLPKYRGPSPITNTILNGDKEAGITIIKMNEEIDGGNIIQQKKIAINKDENYESLSNKLSKLGAKILIEILPNYLSKKIRLKKQNEKKINYTKLIKKQDGLINWNSNASYIEKMIRAYNPWPGTYTYWNKKIIKIKKASLYSNNFRLKPGTVFLTKERKIAVSTSNKSIIIKIIQIEGKKTLSSEIFLRGYPKFIGSILKN